MKRKMIMMIVCVLMAASLLYLVSMTNRGRNLDVDWSWKYYTWGDYQYDLYEFNGMKYARILAYLGSNSTMKIPERILFWKVNDVYPGMKHLYPIKRVVLNTTIGMPGHTQTNFYIENLEAFVVPKESKYLSSEKGILFNKDRTCLIECPQCAELVSYVIPNTVESFGDGEPFAMNKTIKELTFPTNERFTDIYGCYGSGFQKVTIPNNVTYIGESAFSGCKDLVTIVMSKSIQAIAEDAFSGCDKLQYKPDESLILQCE